MADEVKTVADLIRALQTMPQDAPILIHDSYHVCNVGIYKVCKPGERSQEEYDADAVVLWDGE